jgi:hypothetical protein
MSLWANLQRHAGPLARLFSNLFLTLRGITMESTRQNDRSGLLRLRNLFLSLSGRFSRRTALIAGATLAVAAGVAFNWSALVALGVAPLILGLLPCAAMCALGLCANRLGRDGKCSSEVSNSPNSGTGVEFAAKSKALKELSDSHEVPDDRYSITTAGGQAATIVQASKNRART